MDVIVSGVRGREKVEVPVGSVFSNLVPEHGEKFSTAPFALAARLQGTSKREVFFQTYKLTEVLEQA